MKLHIHVGIHKTGTSAIQEYGKANREQLLSDYGILFPETFLPPNATLAKPDSSTGHTNLRGLLAPGAAVNYGEAFEPLISEIETSRCSQVILSDEILSRPDLVVSDEFRDFLTTIFDDAQIWVYLRNHLDWANSFYREALTWPNVRADAEFNEYWERRSNWLSFSKRVLPWARQFGRENLNIIDYDARENKNVAEDFFRGLDPSFSIKPQDERDQVFVNSSLPYYSVPTVGDINKLSISPFRKTDIIHGFLSEMAALDVEAPPVSYAFSTKLQKVVERDVNQLYDRYGFKLSKAVNQSTDLSFSSSNEAAKYQLSALSESDRQRVTEVQAKYLARAEANQIVTLAPEGHRGRWGVSCMTNGTVEQIMTFSRYHLALGATHIVIYLDADENYLREFQTQENNITVVLADSKFWVENIGSDEVDLDSKLEIAHLAARHIFRKIGNVDTTITLDIDELLWCSPKTTVAEYLAFTSRTVDQIEVLPMEAVYRLGSDYKNYVSRYFKLPPMADKRNTTRFYDASIAVTEANIRFLDIEMLKRIHDRLPYQLQQVGKRIYRRLLSTAHRLKHKSNKVVSAVALPVKKVKFGQDAKEISGSMSTATHASDDKYFDNFQRSFISKERTTPRQVALRRFMSRKGENANFLFTSGFLGHRAGRMFSSMRLNLLDYNSHRQYASDQRYSILSDQRQLFVLHFDAVSFEEWEQKFMARIENEQLSVMMGPSRNRQLNLFKNTTTRAERLALFEWLYCLDDRELTDLAAKEFIVRLELPQLDAALSLTEPKSAHAKPG